LPRQPAPEAAKAKPEAQKPIASRELPTPAPAPVVASKPVAPTTTPAAELPTEKEIQARQLLNQTLSSLPVQPTPADPKAKREVEKQARDVAKREVQMKAEAEAKARKQVLQLEEESRHRAQEEARRRIEMEKRAGQGSASSTPVHQETAPVVAAVKSPEPQPVKVQKAVATTPAEKKKNGNSKRDTQTPYADNPSASKEQRLSDLLQAYQRDEINAEQYHATRRKIISQ
jgi:hypothetical protein